MTNWSNYGKWRHSEKRKEILENWENSKKMNKERYNQIIDEVYLNYVNKLTKTSYLSLKERLEKEEFISVIKQSKEFSETWGLKIEERELSLEERMKIWQNQQDGRCHFIMELLDNIPNKLITLTYNKETIESYE